MKSLCLLITICTFIVYTSLVHAQQPYIGDPKAACESNPNNLAAIYIGYSCNGGPISCKTNLTFRSQYPYNTISAIASLLGVETNDIAQANPSYNTDALEWNKLVYVPITCSCEQGSQYYRKFTILNNVSPNEPYFNIVNNTYQGLTTCQAIAAANSQYSSNPVQQSIISLTIPLRCACPTNNQRSSGINSLFSYVVGEGETISSISTQLKVDSKSIREANQLLENSTVYPFTTLLIPVMNKKSTSTLSPGVIGGIAAGAAAALLGIGGAIKFSMQGNKFSCFNSTTNVIHNNNGRKGNKKGEKPTIKKDNKGPKVSDDPGV